MNYITKIQKQNDILKEGLIDLKRYISLAKFNYPENFVNVLDITLRIEEIQRAVSDIQYDYNTFKEQYNERTQES